MVYFILLIAGNILLETYSFGLDCTNDYDRLMSCYIDAPSCSGLNITLKRKSETETCAFNMCDRRCCCSMEMTLVIGDIFLATVYKDGQSVHSQNVDVHATIKPQTPFLYPVKKLNGIYQIQWKTNTERSILEELWAIVTYHKKGDLNEKSEECVKPSTMQDNNYYEILDRKLEPSTTYVVSVRTNTSFGVLSDSSNEEEFTTASSTNSGVIAIILCLSVAAVVVSGAAFASFVKLKGKLWDKAAKDEKPKLLDIKPNKKVILTPESLSVYSLSVETFVPKDSLALSKESLSDTGGGSGQTSGISTASSSLDYAEAPPVDMVESVVEALKRALPIFSPVEDTFSLEEPTQSSVIPPPYERISSPIVFENKSYISTKTSPTDDVDMQVTGDSGYHSSDGPALHDIITPPHGSTIMETDMSYQPCAQSEEACGDSQNPLPVDCEYQEFEKLVEQSNNTSPVEKAEECRSLIPSLTNNAKTAEVVQSHSVVDVSNEIIVDYGYHCV